jgi:hypothetical protein
MLFRRIEDIERKESHRLTVFLKNVVAVLPTLSKFFWRERTKHNS